MRHVSHSSDLVRRASPDPNARGSWMRRRQGAASLQRPGLGVHHTNTDRLKSNDKSPYKSHKNHHQGLPLVSHVSGYSTCTPRELVSASMKNT